MAVLFIVDQLNVITDTIDDKVNKSQIKKRSKLTKKYFKNGKTENDLDALNIISSECTKLLLVSNKRSMFETWVKNWMTA